MTNENTNKGGNLGDTKTEGAGNDGRENSSTTTGVSTDNSTLEKTTTGGGTPVAESEANGPQADTALGTWGIAGIWNQALLEQEQRPVVPRDYLWASELGKPFIEVYLKMKGVVPTNPPNARALRKFEAGNVFEWIVSLILKRADVLKEGQKWCEWTYPSMLRVTGKADFIGGGTADIKKASDFIEFLARADIPNVFLRGFDRIIKYLAERYPQGIEEMPIEVKSVSSYAMDLLETSKKPIRYHRFQLFHYLKAMDYKKGLMVYICRDDLRMMEFAIFNPSPIEDEYKAYIETMSGYWQRQEEPPKEPFVIFDEDARKFSKNIGIEWSNYLSLLYGFEDPREYSETYAKVATKWNNVLARMKRAKLRQEWLGQRSLNESDVLQEKIEGKRTKRHYIMNGETVVYLPDDLQKSYEMTKNNLGVIDEISAAGFDINNIVSKMPIEAIGEEESE